MSYTDADMRIIITTLCLSVAACGGSKGKENTSSSEMAQETQEAAQAASAPASNGTVVDVAVSTGQHNTLVAAAKAAGLVGVLAGPGPITVFAPTDAAFAKLPEGTLDMLLEPANKDKLAAILKHHVVQGRVSAEQVAGLETIKTVGGDFVKVTKGDGGVILDNGASVVTADVSASNGIVHVVDTVLLPE